MPRETEEAMKALMSKITMEFGECNQNGFHIIMAADCHLKVSSIYDDFI